VLLVAMDCSALCVKVPRPDVPDDGCKGAARYTARVDRLGKRRRGWPWRVQGTPPHSDPCGALETADSVTVVSDLRCRSRVGMRLREVWSSQDAAFRSSPLAALHARALPRWPSRRFSREHSGEVPAHPARLVALFPGRTDAVKAAPFAADPVRG
jgi:hypothetical protein